MSQAEPSSSHLGEVQFEGVQFERLEDGLRIHVPAAGLWKGSHGLFGFSILWMGMSTCLIGIVVYSLLAQGEFLSVLPVVMFGLLFESIGIAIFLIAMHLGTRVSLVVTSYGNLFVSIESQLRKRTRAFDLESFDSIDVVESGVEVNKRPVLELGVMSKEGKLFGFLSNLPEPTLGLLARELNEDIDRFRSPPSSTIELE